MKIGIYLPNGSIGDVLLSNPENGNPGIGGTQFLLFSLPYYVLKYCENKFEFLILANSSKSLETSFNVIAADGLVDSALKAKENSCDILIFRPGDDDETREFLDKIIEIKLRSIAWLHTTPKFLLKRLLDNNHIIRCVCVGRAQYELLRDHPIIKKLAMIYNGVDSSGIPFNQNQQKTKSVVFLGSLTYAKGFHIWAKMWNKILKSHPDATLYVIGSGKLYDRNSKVGSLGLAEEKYEKMFRKYIIDESGKIKESIKFLGVLGSEKFRIMSEACVGLASHPNLRETFCLGAVEFQLCGTPVVSSRYGGLTDTVENGIGGFLKNSKRGRFKSVIKLLSNPELSAEMGESGRKIAIEKFNYERITKEWESLFEEVYANTDTTILKPGLSDPYSFDKLRENLRILKLRWKIFRVIIPGIYILHTLEYIRLRIQNLSF